MELFQNILEKYFLPKIDDHSSGEIALENSSDILKGYAIIIGLLLANMGFFSVCCIYFVLRLYLIHRLVKNQSFLWAVINSFGMWVDLSIIFKNFSTYSIPLKLVMAALSVLLIAATLNSLRACWTLDAEKIKSIDRKKDLE